MLAAPARQAEARRYPTKEGGALGRHSGEWRSPEGGGYMKIRVRPNDGPRLKLWRYGLLPPVFAQGESAERIGRKTQKNDGKLIEWF